MKPKQIITQIAIGIAVAIAVDFWRERQKVSQTQKSKGYIV